MVRVMSELSKGFSCCAVIPVYNHEHAIGDVVEQVIQYGLFCVLVDDGSQASCAATLDQLALRFPVSVCVVRLPLNQGKGGACIAGFREAARRGFSHALQLDADGQHKTHSIPHFVDLARRYPSAAICGYAVYDHSVPKGRLIGRYVTHLWVWINTLSLAIRDSMCGFRVYPLNSTLKLLDHTAIGLRMNYDTDIIVKLFWAGTPVVNAPVQVTYPQDGVSHFRMLQDNLLISRMHALHFLGMLLRMPKLLLRSFS